MSGSTGNWSIQVREFTIPFTGFFAHTFLALVDPQGNIVTEINGQLGQVAPSFDGVQSAARQAAARHCASSKCRALMTIAAVLRIDLDATAATVGTPRPISSDRDAVARAALNNAVLDHPDRFTAMCAVSAEIVAGFSAPARAGEAFVPVSLLHLEQDTDQRHGDACPPALLARLLRTLAARAAIRNARSLCAG